MLLHRETSSNDQMSCALLLFSLFYFYSYFIAQTSLRWTMLMHHTTWNSSAQVQVKLYVPRCSSGLVSHRLQSTLQSQWVFSNRLSSTSRTFCLSSTIRVFELPSFNSTFTTSCHKQDCFWLFSVTNHIFTQATFARLHSQHHLSDLSFFSSLLLYTIRS